MNKFFNKAIKLAKTSKHPSHKLACVFTYKNRIISTGVNSSKTDPNAPKVYKEGSKITHQCMHAEYTCLKKFDSSFIRNQTTIPLKSGITAYIARIRVDGSLSMARPCNACMSLLKRYEVHDIFYTIDFGYSYEKI